MAGERSNDPVKDYANKVLAAKLVAKALRAAGTRDVEQTGHIVSFTVDDIIVAVARVDLKHRDA